MTSVLAIVSKALFDKAIKGKTVGPGKVLDFDRYVSTKHPPLLPEDQRAAIVDAIRYISYTHVNQFDTETILHELRPKYYVKGRDWEGRLPPEQVRLCAEHGIGVVYLDTVLDSSSRILEQFLMQKQNTR